MRKETLIKQINVLLAKQTDPATRKGYTQRHNLLKQKLAMLAAMQDGKRPGAWVEYTGKRGG